MKRTLALLVGLGLAAAGLYALLSGTAPRQAEPPPEPAPAAAPPVAQPTGEIDEASRRRLDALLREAAEER